VRIGDVNTIRVINRLASVFMYFKWSETIHWGYRRPRFEPWLGFNFVMMFLILALLFTVRR